MLLDKYLYYLSPLGMVWLEMCGCPGTGPLIHSQIKDLLRQKTSILVFPGGFMEVAGFCRSHETLYLHMYPYWMHMAREFACDAYTTIGYNLAGRYFQQSSLLRSFRLFLARNCLPGIFPIGIIGTSHDVPVYLLTHQIDPDHDTLDSIQDSIRIALDTHENINGGRHRL